MTLAISIPEKKVSAWMAETTVPGTADWISQLPIADSLESARDLYQALYTLNRMELAPKNRLELMELYRSPVSQVTGQLQNRLAVATYPLSPQRFRLAEFVRDLQVEMAYGYKLSLFDMETQRRPVWGKSSGRTKAIFRSVHYLGNTLVRSAACYLANPRGIWKEIHSLIQYAETSKCLNEPVEEFDAESDRHSTILKRYKEILLLGIANPYRMPLGQAKLVNAFVYRWADLANLKSAESSKKMVDRQFVVDLQSDEPGTIAGKKKLGAGQQEASLKVLETKTLVDHVESMLRRLETGTPAKQLDLGIDCLEEACQDMLKRMLDAWKGDQVRTSARIPINGEASVCTGLVPIHHFVHQLQKLDGKTGGIGGLGQGSPVLLGKEKIDGKIAPATFKAAKWEVVNASSGGALVRGRDNTGVNVRVGDLVALLDAGSRAGIKLFAVRWMKEMGSKGLEVGLELMSENVSSIMVGQERDGGSYVPALMLDKVNSGSGKLPRTLVLQKDLRGKQKDLELLEPGDVNSKWVRILETIDKTNTYERVTFVSLTRRDK